MLFPAAVSAAAVAGWLLAVLSQGLSLPAEEDPGFSLCSHCFYRQTPPQGASAGALLRPLCHRPSGGQAFATLYNPTCDTAACFAFHLSHGWAESGGEEEREPSEFISANQGDDFIDFQVTPALLRRDAGAPEHASPSEYPLQPWDSLVTALVQSAINPQCDSTGGDLYVLLGTGGAGLAVDGGEEECKARLWWSAVCCAAPEGGFSVGLVRETDGEERVVGVKELEEILGVTELFSGGCGATDGQTEGSMVGLLGEALPGIKAKLGSDTADDDSGENVGERVESQVTGEQVAGVDAQPEEADVDDVTEEASPQEVTSESTGEEQGEETLVKSSESVGSSDSKDTAAEVETAAEAEPEPGTESSSTLLYIISSFVSLLTAPLRPMFSTITQLPGQVTYVLQEDLGVLSVLPGETFSLFHLMVSDLVSVVGSATDLLLGLGETCFSGMYHCTSSMLGALYTSCHTGVTGVGTLAGDTVGIFGGAVDNAWWVTRLFGGRLWEHSEGYVGAVVSEMGGQAKAVGGGLGRLAWRGGNGVGSVVRTGGGLIVGTVEAVVAVVREAFGQESD